MVTTTYSSAVPGLERPQCKDFSCLKAETSPNQKSKQTSFFSSKKLATNHPSSKIHTSPPHHLTCRQGASQASPNLLEVPSVMFTSQFTQQAGFSPSPITPAGFILMRASCRCSFMGWELWIRKVPYRF